LPARRPATHSMAKKKKLSRFAPSNSFLFLRHLKRRGPGCCRTCLMKTALNIYSNLLIIWFQTRFLCFVDQEAENLVRAVRGQWYIRQACAGLCVSFRVYRIPFIILIFKVKGNRNVLYKEFQYCTLLISLVLSHPGERTGK
jgi:hypothetical protein